MTAETNTALDHAEEVVFESTGSEMLAEGGPEEGKGATGSTVTP